jgi:hypothetical protein
MYGVNQGVNVSGIGTYLDGTANGANLYLQTASAGTLTTKMTITSAGNVGIGTNSPSVLLHLSGSSGEKFRLETTASTPNYIGLYTGSTRTHYLGKGSGGSNDLYLGVDSSANIFLETAATTRMTISSGGNVLIGSTSFDYRLVSVNSTNNRAGYFRNEYGTGYTNSVLITEASAAAGSGFNLLHCYAGSAQQFYVRGDGVIYAQNTTVQSISDIRTKENIVNSTEGLNKILGLRPVRFDFKEGFGNNKKNQLGFIAQEVESIFPDAVDIWGESDEENNPYKSFGSGALIPLLVKAIQELSAELNDLKAIVATK